MGQRISNTGLHRATGAGRGTGKRVQAGVQSQAKSTGGCGQECGTTVAQSRGTMPAIPTAVVAVAASLCCPQCCCCSPPPRRAAQAGPTATRLALAAAHAAVSSCGGARGGRRPAARRRCRAAAARRAFLVHPCGREQGGQHALGFDSVQSTARACTKVQAKLGGSRGKATRGSSRGAGRAGSRSLELLQIGGLHLEALHLQDHPSNNSAARFGSWGKAPRASRVAGLQQPSCQAGEQHTGGAASAGSRVMAPARQHSRRQAQAGTGKAPASWLLAKRTQLNKPGQQARLALGPPEHQHSGQPSHAQAPPQRLILVCRRAGQ